MKILFITQLLPYPAVTGGTTKTYKLLTQLACAHDVWVTTFHDSALGSEDAKNLERRLSIHVISLFRPQVTYSSKKMIGTAFRSLFSLDPFRVLKYRDSEMITLIKKLTKKVDFDVVYLDHDTSYQYLKHVVSKRALVIYDEHNIDSIATWRNVFESMRKPWTRLFCIWDGLKYFWLEKQIVGKVHQVACISEVDRSVLLQRGGDADKMVVLPVPYTTKNLFHYGQKTILFVGLMSWAPNKLGFLWFYTKVYPSIRKLIPEVKLVVVGKRVEVDLKMMAAADPSVQFTGEVSDTSTYYRDAGVVIVPIHIGGGIRIKLLEALSFGMPTVSTTLGAEGIDAPLLLLADKPKQFSEAVVKLFLDKNLAETQSKNAVRFMQKHYSTAETSRILESMLLGKA